MRKLTGAQFRVGQSSARVVVRVAGYKTRDVDLERGMVSLTENKAHLKMAGVNGPQLFERSEARMPLRVHDLRVTFVTIALPTGRTRRPPRPPGAPPRGNSGAGDATAMSVRARQ
jgi:hypothetical protein